MENEMKVYDHFDSLDISSHTPIDELIKKLQEYKEAGVTHVIINNDDYGYQTPLDFYTQRDETESEKTSRLAEEKRIADMTHVRVKFDFTKEKEALLIKNSNGWSVLQIYENASATYKPDMDLFAKYLTDLNEKGITDEETLNAVQDLVDTKYEDWNNNIGNGISLYADPFALFEYINDKTI